jgi:hypothetical protein
MQSFKRYLTEANFSAKNFPAQDGISGAGERTQYAPMSSTDERHPDGFPVFKNTILYGSDGSSIKTLEKGTSVHFTYPSKLIKSDEINITKKAILAPVSLESINGTVDGYVIISHVKKPSGKSQGRVSSGSSSQDKVNSKIKELAQLRNKNYEFVSSARPGSTKPDLVVKYDNKPIQFEIKGTGGGSNSLITLFDVSISRNQTHYFAEKIVGLFKRYGQINLTVDPKTDKKLNKTVSVPLASVIPSSVKKMNQLVDFYHDYSDSSVGFPGDQGVIKSGKLPKEFEITDKRFLIELRKLVLDHFAKGGDNYFSIHFRSTDAINSYYTGHGKNVLEYEPVPELKFFGFMTYGGVSGGKMRSGIKVRFDI